MIMLSSFGLFIFIESQGYGNEVGHSIMSVMEYFVASILSFVK